ncbi:nucleoside deaminase [uncultured Clostridium sp.]|uniref:nucleoside deaminase n=1 Tax=uncultured Clostridium sp. TaxID=59620 RepID=UPI0026711FD1|nr:nucleoside deaminase [uncultured Clostridium sp.]
MNFMDLALSEAQKAYDLGEVPVGTVIVKDGEVIAKAYNMKETKKISTAHAEILAIEEASRYIGDWRLNGCDMYVTLEPCAMCAAAIAHSRISNLYIGTFNIDMGACGTVLNLLDYDIFNSRVNTNWCYDKRCSDMLTKFFDMRRKNNK